MPSCLDQPTSDAYCRPNLASFYVSFKEESWPFPLLLAYIKIAIRLNVYSATIMLMFALHVSYVSFGKVLKVRHRDRGAILALKGAF